MNEKAFKILEYNKIVDSLTEKASSPLGKDMCRKLSPLTEIERIRMLQTQTADALTRLFQKGNISFGGAKDIRAGLKRLEIGSTLSIPELLQTASLLENANRAKAYARRDRSDTPADSLDAFFDSLEPLTLLSTEIRRCILSEDEVSDDASPALRSVRRSMKAINDKIHQQLTQLVSSGAKSYLQDSVVTMRDGRYCLPVKAEHKNQVPGMIHDQSSTGSTLFIEPMVVIRLNNEYKELELKEQKEIEKILAELSESAAGHIPEIRMDLEVLSELDFIFARASLAMDMNASMPVLNDRGYIRLRKARHPLISKGKVVPIDLWLGDEFDLLVVTGPNTGGKTVSLKTVGLLSMMGLSGLHIPAADQSEIAVFEEIYADIGDEQSIEQSLSTFSSHMTNVVSFIEKADSRSLVLFDELGAGTDPTEGAALAISILSSLHEKGIRTMATTHYSELKVYALSTPGVENASCEFDVETLRPTYRLLIGVPGKSNAFAISKRLGLPDSIIERAKEQISEKDESFEDVLTSLEQNRIRMENEKQQIETLKAELEAKNKEVSRHKEKLENQRDRILREANEQARQMLQETKEYADQTMKLFHKFQKDHVDTAAMERERTRLRERMKNAQGSSLQDLKPKKQSKELKPEDLKLGEAVHVLSMNLNGTVSTKPDAKGFLFVQMGIIRSKVHISDLELVDEADITGPGLKPTGQGKLRMSKSASVSQEINLIGKTVDEAIASLDKYLDDAYLAHMKSVRVVHGKGTGALRQGVHQYLKRQKHVDSFRLGEFGEGDSGVTIVTFKS